MPTYGFARFQAAADGAAKARGCCQAEDSVEYAVCDEPFSRRFGFQAASRVLQRFQPYARVKTASAPKRDLGSAALKSSAAR